jgi:hypothetical protein
LIRRFTILIFLAVFCAFECAAQTPDSSSNAASNKATPTEKTPATTTAEKNPDTKAKPKKVWTNDDVSSLKGSVSVVGVKSAAGSRSEGNDHQDKEASGPQTERVRKYRDAIDQLRTQIGEADARITQLKNFKAENGGPNGGINPYQGYDMVPPEEQVKQLEARKKQLQGKIEDLENQARKEGIDPGELR